MKRLVFCLFGFLFAINLLAQTDHMKFMGIPLDGQIVEFQKKLEAKGVKYNANNSKLSPVGVRCFDGRFAGKDAYIYVYYDEKTKKVYRAKAVISSPTREVRKQIYNDFRRQLEYKYPEATTEGDRYEGEECISFNLMYLGYINLYQSTNYLSYDSYIIHVDYYDLINYMEHDRGELDDL